MSAKRKGSKQVSSAQKRSKVMTTPNPKIDIYQILLPHLPELTHPPWPAPWIVKLIENCIGQNRPEPVRISQNQSESVRIDQNMSLVVVGGGQIVFWGLVGDLVVVGGGQIVFLGLIGTLVVSQSPSQLHKLVCAPNPAKFDPNTFYYLQVTKTLVWQVLLVCLGSSVSFAWARLILLVWFCLFV